MARLVGVDLPREKRVEIALTYIFGIGRSRAAETLAGTGVNPDRGSATCRRGPRQAARLDRGQLPDRG